MCWRVDTHPRQGPSFEAISSEAPDLLSCAVELELIYRGERRSVIGAYRGRYIFVGPAAIASAERLDMIRYPVFNTAQRAEIDRQLAAIPTARTAPAGKGAAP